MYSRALCCSWPDIFLNENGSQDDGRLSHLIFYNQKYTLIYKHVHKGHDVFILELFKPELSINTVQN